MKPVALALFLAGSLSVPLAAFAQTPPASPGSAPATPTAPPPPAITSPTPSPPAAAPPAAAPTRQMSVSDLTNKDLTGANNDEVGDIERVVESNADKKRHLVISRGGFLGLFETEVMLPLENVAIKGEQIVLRNMSQEQLRALPKFDSDDTGFRRLEDNQSVTVAEER